MATQSSILTWKILWTEEPSRLQSIESERAGHDLATKQQQQLSVDARERPWWYKSRCCQEFAWPFKDTVQKRVNIISLIILFHKSKNSFQIFLYLM